MKNNIVFTLLAVTALLTITACSVTEKDITHRHAKIFTENFDRFYKKFHSDSLFQISRVIFPLKGYSTDGFTETAWTKTNWPYMKTMVYDIDTLVYKTSYKLSDDEFFQKVWTENSGFRNEARFRCIGKRWYLVYLLDVNL